MEDANYDIGAGLAGHDTNDDVRQPSELAVPKTCVKCQHRGFDETQAGIIEDRRQPDYLRVGYEVVHAPEHHVFHVGAKSMVDG